MCRCKSFGNLKDFSQNEQALITWTLKCFLSNSDVGKDFVHRVQWCKVSVAAGTSCLKFGIKIFKIKDYLYVSKRKLLFNTDVSLKTKSKTTYMHQSKNNN